MWWRRRTRRLRFGRRCRPHRPRPRAGGPSRVRRASPAGWPKRVVVGLEAVEIEDRDRHRLLGGERVDLPFHVGEQFAAVPQPGEGVGHGIVLAEPSRSHRAAERDREREQQEDDRGDRADRRHRSSTGPHRARNRGRPGRTPRSALPGRHRVVGCCRAPTLPGRRRRLRPARTGGRRTRNSGPSAARSARARRYDPDARVSRPSHSTRSWPAATESSSPPAPGHRSSPPPPGRTRPGSAFLAGCASPRSRPAPAASRRPCARTRSRLPAQPTRATRSPPTATSPAHSPQPLERSEREPRAAFAHVDRSVSSQPGMLRGSADVDLDP